MLQSLAVTEVKEKSVEKSNRQVHIEMKAILYGVDEYNGKSNDDVDGDDFL